MNDIIVLKSLLNFQSTSVITKIIYYIHIMIILIQLEAVDRRFKVLQQHLTLDDLYDVALLSSTKTLDSKRCLARRIHDEFIIKIGVV